MRTGFAVTSILPPCFTFVGTALVRVHGVVLALMVSLMIAMGCGGSKSTETPAEEESQGAGGEVRKKGTALAKIGDEIVTVEEVMYAWKRSYPGRTPEAGELNKFTQSYLNSALLAAEARRLKLDESEAHRDELIFYERQLLAREMLKASIPEISASAVREHYLKNLDQYVESASVLLDHIVVRESEAEAVGRRLAEGESFENVALEVSLDRDFLENGTRLEWVSGEEPFIGQVGIVPGLAAKLTAYDEGITTGPIKSARGFHWFRIAEKRSSAPKPPEEILEEVERDLRRRQLQTAQRELLRKIRETNPITIYEDAMRRAGSATAREAEVEEEKD